MLISLYGSVDGKPQNYQQIARQFGWSQREVRRVAGSAVRKLHRSQIQVSGLAVLVAAQRQARFGD